MEVDNGEWRGGGEMVQVMGWWWWWWWGVAFANARQ